MSDEPVAWIRYCSDGSYEGPIVDSMMEALRKESGAWTPLFAKREEVARLREDAEYDSGPRHYECALREVNRLRGDMNKDEMLESILHSLERIKAKQNKPWVGLTEDEKHDCYLKIDVWSRCVEAIEAKLKEKNGG